MNEHPMVDEPPNATVKLPGNTPFNDFESADRMVIEANVIRECATQLQTQVLLMRSKADVLQEAAQTLQQQGVRTRRHISECYERCVQTCRHFLAQFEESKPGVLGKIKLAAEEGTICSSELDTFAQRLCSFELLSAAGGLDHNTGVNAEARQTAMPNILNDLAQASALENKDTGFERPHDNGTTELLCMADHDVSVLSSPNHKHPSMPEILSMFDEPPSSIKRTEHTGMTECLQHHERHINGGYQLGTTEEARRSQIYGTDHNAMSVFTSSVNEDAKLSATDLIEQTPSLKKRTKRTRRGRGRRRRVTAKIGGFGVGLNFNTDEKTEEQIPPIRRLRRSFSFASSLR